MNCYQLRDALIDHARGVLAGAGSIAAVETHLEHCSRCASEFATQRALTGALRTIAAASSSLEPTDLLERRLLERFVEERRSTLLSRPAVRWVAAAAVVAAVGATVWLRPNRTDSNRGPIVTVPDPRSSIVESRPPSTVQGVDSAANLTVAPTGAVPARTAAHRPRSHGGRQRPAAQAGPVLDFMPLPAAIGLPAFESGGIVRVDLPVSALPAYGVELGSAPGRSEVQADVLVGQDGQPRAIRLVPAANDSRSRE